MEQQFQPNFIVIVPVYNVAAYLSQCVGSVLSQRASLECILVDDGSTDESGDICDTLACEYPALRVIHVENGGVTAARRIGVEAARGEYITFVDFWYFQANDYEHQKLKKNERKQLRRNHHWRRNNRSRNSPRLRDARPQDAAGGAL